VKLLDPSIPTQAMGLGWVINRVRKTFRQLSY
jgi:hypothetical protein